MKDKIKFCPQCNGCLFDDMMTCCVCGYQFPQEEDDSVPLSAYEDVVEIEEPEPVPSDTKAKQTHLPQEETREDNAVNMTVDCGSCFIDISVRQK